MGKSTDPFPLCNRNNDHLRNRQKSGSMEMESTSFGLLSLTFHHILLSSPLFKRSMKPSSSFRTLKVFTFRSLPSFMASFGMERIVLSSGIGFFAFKTTPEGISLRDLSPIFLKEKKLLWPKSSAASSLSES